MEVVGRLAGWQTGYWCVAPTTCGGNPGCGKHAKRCGPSAGIPRTIRTYERGFLDKTHDSIWQKCRLCIRKPWNNHDQMAANRRKVARGNCKSERYCATETHNSIWPKERHCVGKLRNSDGQTEINAAQSCMRGCKSECSCTDKNQNSNWQMCQRGVGMETKSVSRTASDRGKSAKGDAHSSAVAQTRTKTATGGCAKEASGWKRSRSAEQHQIAASQQKAMHIRAQLHGQEPKQQLADVPKKRRKGDELGQPKSIRSRQVSVK